MPPFSISRGATPKIGVYAISRAGATLLMDRLRIAPQDLSMVPLEAWLMTQVRNAPNLRVFTWDKPEDLVQTLDGRDTKMDVPMAGQKGAAS